VSGLLREQIDRARESFVSARIPEAEAALDAEVLARHVLGWDRAQLLTRSSVRTEPSYSDGQRASPSLSSSDIANSGVSTSR
jgi:PrmC N-terminal domain